MPSINKIINVDNKINFILLSILGDENELHLYFDPVQRKCFLANVNSSSIDITISYNDGAYDSGTTVCETIEKASTFYLDRNAIDVIGKSSTLKDCSFTSKSNVWGFNYRNQVVSSESFSNNNHCNRILADIVISQLS